MNHSTANIDHLWSKFKQKDCEFAKEDLVNYYLPFVNQIVNRVKISLPLSISKEELVSHGIFGLFDAMLKFDPNRGYKFETYAYPRIKGAILDGLRAMDWMPTNLRQKEKKIVNLIGEMEQRLGRTVSDEELAEEMGFSTKDLYNLLDQLNVTTVLSLDKMLSPDGEESASLLDTVGDSPEKSPESLLDQSEVKRVLVDAINKLPEKEKLVVALYYYEGLNLKEISKVMSLSESRISQLHTKAIFRLRGRLSRQKKLLL